MKQDVHIAVVEDRSEFRRLLIDRLNSRPGWKVVAECGSAVEALQAVPPARPELVLVDLLMPGESGIELIPKLKAALPRASLVVLTVVDSPEHIIRAIESGACGYILKGGSPEDVIGSVEDVLAGGAVMGPAVARRVVEWFQHRQTVPKPSHFGLTEREWEVLRMAARGKQQGEISHALGIALNTVKNHFRNIYEKLGVGSLTDALVKINDGRGLLDGR